MYPNSLLTIKPLVVANHFTHIFPFDVTVTDLIFADFFTLHIIPFHATVTVLIFFSSFLPSTTGCSKPFSAAHSEFILLLLCAFWTSLGKTFLCLLSRGLRDDGDDDEKTQGIFPKSKKPTWFFFESF